MKQVKFKCKVNEKEIKGNWFCDTRPTNPKKIAERLIGHKVENFVFAIKDIKEGKPIKCEVE